MLADLFGEGPLPGLTIFSDGHMAERDHLPGSSCKSADPVHVGSTLLTQSPPGALTRELRASLCAFRGHSFHSSKSLIPYEPWLPFLHGGASTDYGLIMVTLEPGMAWKISKQQLLPER